MFRFGGLSEERPSVIKTRSKLGTHLSTQCSGDERQSRPCAARYENPRPVVWKHDTLPLDLIRFFANPTSLAHADTSRDVLPRAGTSQGGRYPVRGLTSGYRTPEGVKASKGTT
ncbi:hypothetical protein TNCV_1082221, partial [Trichonephila clavipes]